MTGSRRQIRFGTVLLYMAAVYQATQYMRAGALMDGGMGVLDFGAARLPLGQIGGLFAGLTINLSLAYAATRLPSIQGKMRIRLAQIGFCGLLAMSPLLIGPVNYALLDQRVMTGLEPLRMMLAILWASAMDVSIALVGLVDTSLVTAGAPPSVPPGEITSLSGKDAARRAAAKAQRAEPVFACANCERTFATQNALNAHERSHKTKIIGYVANFEPVVKDGKQK